MNEDIRLSIKEAEELLKNDPTICFSSELGFARLVQNDDELIEFFSRFVDYYNGECFVWYDAFEDEIEIDDEDIEYFTKKVRILSHNQFYEKPFKLTEDTCQFCPRDKIKVTYPAPYPCIVSIMVSDDFDRGGVIAYRMVDFIPLAAINHTVII
jgi:hypothetical protein